MIITKISERTETDGFYVIFDKKVSLEEAVRALVDDYGKFSNSKTGVEGPWFARNFRGNDEDAYTINVKNQKYEKFYPEFYVMTLVGENPSNVFQLTTALGRPLEGVASFESYHLYLKKKYG